MEILKGKVQDPGFPDTEVTYIKTDDGKAYYFIENGTLKNGNYIATPILKEGIGHAPYTSLGLITPNGEVLIPFENKNIQVLSNDLLLVERNVPVSESVVEALKKQNDPLAAAELIESANTIKQQIKSVMGLNGSFVFDNQFSEAALYTTAGANLANNYFSFIGAKEGAYFMSTNVIGSPISKYDPFAYAMQENNDTVNSEEIPKDQESNENEADIQNQVEENAQNQPTENVSVPEISSDGSEQLNAPIENNSDDNLQVEISENSETEPQSEKNIDIPLYSEENLNPNLESPLIPNIDSNGATESNDSSTELTAEVPNIFEEETDNQEEIPTTTEGNFIEQKENTIDTEEKVDAHEDFSVESEKMETDPLDETENDESSDDDGGSSKIEYEEQEEIDDALNNPVIVNATNTIKKLLEENRRQRQLLDQRESEIETLTSSNDILKEDNDSKTKEIISVRNSMNKYRKDNTSLLKENKRLTSINSRQEELINNLKMQNTTLKEQVAGITALNSAVAEANNLFTADENIEDNNKDYSYLDEDEDPYQYKKTNE